MFVRTIISVPYKLLLCSKILNDTRATHGLCVMDIEKRLRGHGSECSCRARKTLLSAVSFRELNMEVTTPDSI